MKNNFIILLFFIMLNICVLFSFNSSLFASEFYIYKSIDNRIFLTNTLKRHHLGRFKENYYRYMPISSDLVDETTLNELLKSTEVKSKENKFDSIINKYSKKYFIDFELIKSIIKSESKFNKNYKSDRNRFGLMLINDDIYYTVTGETLSENNLLYSPDINISVGSAYLVFLYNKYPTLELALAAYISSQELVDEIYSIPEKSWIIDFITSVTENYYKMLNQHNINNTVDVRKQNGKIILYNR